MDNFMQPQEDLELKHLLKLLKTFNHLIIIQQHSDLATLNQLHYLEVIGEKEIVVFSSTTLKS